MEFEPGCRPGIPVAPRALRFELKDGYDDRHRTALLRWWPSQIFDENGNISQEQKIVGYRIYVNGQPKGMVKAHKSRAMVEGLRLQQEYKITVVAIGTIGESLPSNAAIIYVPNMTPEKVTPRRKLKPSKSLENRNFKELPEKPRKRDVDTIEQIISEIQNNCEVDKENIDQKIPTVTSTITDHKQEVKNNADDTEDYEKLLNDLDQQTDDDIIEKVLKRYGLDEKDFEYATPKTEVEFDMEELNSKISDMNHLAAETTHEISLD